MVEIANVRGPYTKISIERFNLNSHEQIKNYLLANGWEPTQWNVSKKTGQRTSPKLTEDSYPSIKGEIGQLIARRNVLVHRRNTILNIKDPENKGWINSLRSDGRISAEAVPMACNTGRYQHKNVVNVPSTDAIYGEQMRSLYYTKPPYVMVGVDAKGLEARTEAHNCFPFPGGEEYAKELLEGDVHAKNAAIFGTTRSGAKAPKYALTYGCTPQKLQTLLKCDPHRARKLYGDFWKGNTALAGFKEAVERIYKQRGGKSGGYIKGLDGRKLFPRSLHSIVNLKFQSDGAILIKKAMSLLFNEWLPQTDIDAKLVIQMHDEWQARVHKDHAERYSELALKSLEEAGKYFNYNVPIIGEAMVGRNWAETH